MATGKATIKGRNGTSASGKKVSQYSPQYSQTTGKTAEKRGTTSASIALATDLSPEQKATATALGWTVEQARAYDPSTQVALADGSIIQKVERVGSSGTGETGVKVYESAAARTAEKAAQAQEAREARQAQQAAEAEYQPILGANGEVIDAIQQQGGQGEGEGEVTYKSGSFAKSAKQFASEAAQRTKLAAMDITNGMSEEMKNAIMQAREEVIERVDAVEQNTIKTEYYKKDQKSALSTPFFGINKQTASMGIDNSKISPFRTKQQAAEAEFAEQHAGNRIAMTALSLYKATESVDALKTAGAGINTRLYEGITSKVMPTAPELAEARSKAFTSIGLENTRLAIVEKSGVAGKAISSVMDQTYETVREKPASAAVEAAILYASGGLAGAEWKVGGKVAGAGIKTAAKKIGTKEALAIGSKLTSKGAAKAVNLGAMGLIPVSYAAEDIALKQAGATQQERIEAAIKTTGKLAVTGIGFSKGYKAADKLLPTSRGASTEFSLSDALKKAKAKKPAKITLEEQQGELVAKEYQTIKTKKLVNKAKASPFKIAKKQSLTEITLQKTPEGELVSKQFASSKDIQSAVRTPKKRVISKGKPELKEITLEEREGDLITKSYASKKDLAETVKIGSNRRNPAQDAIYIGKKPKPKLTELTLEQTPEGELITKEYASKKDIAETIKRNKEARKDSLEETIKKSVPQRKKLTEITLEEREGELITKTYTPRKQILATKRATDVGILKRKITGKAKKRIQKEIYELGTDETAAGTIGKMQSRRSQQLMMLEKPKEVAQEELAVIDLEKDIVFDYVPENIPKHMELQDVQIVDLSTIKAPERSFAENVMIGRVKLKQPESKMLARQKNLSKLITKKPVQEQKQVVDLSTDIIIPKRTLAEQVKLKEPVSKMKPRKLKQQLKMESKLEEKVIEIQKPKLKAKVKQVQEAVSAASPKPPKTSYAISIPARKPSEVPKISFAVPEKVDAIQSIRITPVTAQITKVIPKIREAVKQTTPVPEATKEALKDVVIQKTEVKQLPRTKLTLDNVVSQIPETASIELKKTLGEKKKKRMKATGGALLTSKTKVATYSEMFGKPPVRSSSNAMLKSGKKQDKMLSGSKSKPNMLKGAKVPF